MRIHVPSHVVDEGIIRLRKTTKSSELPPPVTGGGFRVAR